MNELHQAASLIRRVLLQGLSANTDGEVRTSGSCLYASVMLKQCLENFKLVEQATVRGGAGEDKQGLLGMDGVWHGHYWLEVTTLEKEQFILDITADQFGYGNIVLEKLDKLRHLYHFGMQQETEYAASEVLSNITSYLQK